MSVIKLENLDIYPLNSEELSLWLSDIPALEKRLDCVYDACPIEGLFKDVAYSQFILGLSETLENWIWFTYWFIIRKSDKKIIGTLAFNGKPNSNKEVEIGYALGKEYEHKGYMTQALTGLLQWVKQNTEVKYIIAETKLDNYSSQNLLTRCEFEQYKQTDCSLFFKLKL